MFKNLRAAIARWIAPTETPAPATTDNSIAGGVHDSARVVQARDISTLNTGDTHHGDTHHHNGTTNTIGHMHGGTTVMAHEVNGPAIISGNTGDISWGNITNSGIINAGGTNTVTNTVIGSGRATTGA